jgi:hypothetical protein
VLHYLRRGDCDPRALLDQLAQQYRLLITLHDLALPAAEPVERGTCGTEGCGAGSGGCASCSAGACSSCAHAKSARKPVSASASYAGSSMTVALPGTALEPQTRVPLL